MQMNVEYWVFSCKNGIKRLNDKFYSVKLMNNDLHVLMDYKYLLAVYS